MSLLQEFYRDRVVLVTGATGFLGKVLLYKLLVACPDIRRILILIRAKRGKSCSERFCNLLSKPPFSEIPRSSLNKVSYVSADLMKPGLGLSSEDHEILLKSDVSVVFHMAASIRFTDTLDVALKSNTLPALVLLNICQQIPHLQAFVFVSTAFSNFPREIINEEIYPVESVDLRHITDIKQLDMKYLENVSKQRCCQSTYTFSKALAEIGIQQNNTSLPVAILRPSVVLSSWKDPAPGWIDNFNGTVGLMTSSYLGEKRILLCDGKKVIDFIPVDVCINSMLAVAWETAKHGKRGQCTVYNCVSSACNPITWNQYWSMSGQQIVKYPSSKAQWYYYFQTTRFYLFFLLLWICLDLIPACFLFIVQFFTSSDSNRILQTTLLYFKYNFIVLDGLVREVKYTDSNMRNLLDKLTAEDRTIFNFDVQQLNWIEYLTDHVKGIRQYILKEDYDTLQYARKRYMKLYLMHWAVKCCIAYICYRLVKYLCTRIVM